ncbi:protein of unknown function [Xenorhabdus bovienii]|uniref:Uncharacterized protein n=1 Tax=Xenorhabdus bovienii TaxID=40576 RepID=A0A0B6X7X0_XENBV|nr:protein of unknown function [Xenorhabdus bovienii]
MFLLRDNAHQRTCIYLENTLFNIIFFTHYNFPEYNPALLDLLPD